MFNQQQDCWARALAAATAFSVLMAAVGIAPTGETAAVETMDIGPDSSREAATGQAGATTLSAEEEELLARLVRAEAEGEPYAGKVAVAAVVLNRLEHPDFPDTVTGIVYQPAQFEPVLNGTINKPARPVDRNAVRDALRGWDPSDGALYFFNPAKTGNAFVWSRPVIKMIGNHRFTS